MALGMGCAGGTLPDKDLDVELLIVYLRRSIKLEALPGTETVIRFKFSDRTRLSDWWLLVNGSTIDVFLNDPGRDVDIYLGTDPRTMIQVWMGDLSYRAAIADGRMKVTGPSGVTRDITSWLAPHSMANICPAREIA